MIYASNEAFGGQRASVGRAVLFVSPKQAGSLRPGHGEDGDEATPAPKHIQAVG